MMDCRIIQDLLPLYADGCCSEETARAVEAHLQTCADCRDMLHQMRGELPPPPDPIEQEAARSMKKGIQKLRRRWLASLAAVLVLMAVVRVGWNQIRGTGLHPTNLNEYRICTAFLRELEQGDYEEAYAYFDIDAIRTDWAPWNFDEAELAQLETRGKAMFLQSSAALKEVGLTVWHYLKAYRIDDVSTFYFTVTVGDTRDTISIDVTDRGIAHVSGGNGYLPAPDALTQMSLWREYLWQDYSGCHYDWQTGTYIYD